MKKKLFFFSITFWILLTRAYDAYCTFQYTPDLSLEANPLVSVFGLSWTPLLLIITALSFYVVYAFYQVTFGTFNALPEDEGYSFSDFIGYTYTGERQAWYAVLYKLPNTWRRMHHIMGHLMPPALAFTGVVSTLMWLGLNYSNWYIEIHSAPLIYSTLFVGSTIICYLWYKKQYAIYISRSVMEPK